MQASLSVLVGIVMGVVVLVFASRRGVFREDALHKTLPFDWIVLAAGALGLLILVTGMLFNTRWFPIPSILLAPFGATLSLGALIKKRRRWQVWVGLILGGLPALFWLLFFLGHVISPEL